MVFIHSIYPKHCATWISSFDVSHLTAMTCNKYHVVIASGLFVYSNLQSQRFWIYNKNGDPFIYDCGTALFIRGLTPSMLLVDRRYHLATKTASWRQKDVQFMLNRNHFLKCDFHFMSPKEKHILDKNILQQNGFRGVSLVFIFVVGCWMGCFL